MVYIISLSIVPSAGVHSDCPGDSIIASSQQLPTMSGVQVHDFNASIECISPVEIVTNPIHSNVICMYIKVMG